MHIAGWIQLALFSVMLLLLTKPMGLYLVQVLDAGGRTWLDPALRPVERLTYRVAGVDPARSRTGSNIPCPMLIFSLVSCCSPTPSCGCRICCRSTRRDSAGWPGTWPSTPRSASPPTPTGRATAANRTMSYLSQMVALAIHNFFSAAVGIAIAAALVRGIARHTAADHRQFLGAI